MAYTETTIKILRNRIEQLESERVRLKRENERLRRACEVFDFIPAPEPQTGDMYDLGGSEWIDPITGVDTWDHPSEPR